MYSVSFTHLVLPLGQSLTLRSPKSPHVPRVVGNGYGVASEDLEYETNEDEEDYEEDEDLGDGHSNSSGASSPSYSPSSPPEMSEIPTGMSTKVCDEDAPESHERTTKDLLNKPVETNFAISEHDIIDLRGDREDVSKDNKTDPRMPTILSLVNEPQNMCTNALSTPVETTAKRGLKVVHMIDDESDDSDLKIIDKPAGFNSKSSGSKSDPNPVFIDLDQDEFSDDEDSYVVDIDSDDEDENIPSDDEEDEDEQIHDEAEMLQEEDSDKAKSLEERDDQSSSSEHSSGSEHSSQPSSPPNLLGSKDPGHWHSGDLSRLGDLPFRVCS